MNSALPGTAARTGFVSGDVDWLTLVYQNGELRIRRISHTRAEARQLANRLHVDFERPGWVEIGETGY